MHFPLTSQFLPCPSNLPGIRGCGAGYCCGHRTNTGQTSEKENISTILKDSLVESVFDPVLSCSAFFSITLAWYIPEKYARKDTHRTKPGTGIIRYIVLLGGKEKYPVLWYRILFFGPELVSSISSKVGALDGGYLIRGLMPDSGGSGKTISQVPFSRANMN